MREQFKQLPVSLQKQVLIRIGIGILFFLLFLVISLCFRDLYLSLPCLLFAGFLIVNGSCLFYKGLAGRYIRIQGVCHQIETTGIRRRIRYIHITMEQGTVKLPVRQRIKHLAVGDAVSIYLSDREPVYEQEDGYLICSYFALERKKKE